MLEELGHESVSTLRILSVCNTIYHDLGNACAGKSVQQNMLQTLQDVVEDYALLLLG